MSLFKLFRKRDPKEEVSLRMARLTEVAKLSASQNILGNTENAQRIVSEYLREYFGKPPFSLANANETNKLIYRAANIELIKNAFSDWNVFIKLTERPFPIHYYYLISLGYINQLCIPSEFLTHCSFTTTGTYSAFKSCLFEFPSFSDNLIEADNNPGKLNHGRKTPRTKFLLIEKNDLDPISEVRAFSASISGDSYSLRRLNYKDGELSSSNIGWIFTDEVEEGKQKKAFDKESFLNQLIAKIPPPDANHIISEKDKTNMIISLMKGN